MKVSSWVQAAQYILAGRLRRVAAKEILAYVDKVLANARLRNELEDVRFFYDCYQSALAKACNKTREDFGHLKIQKTWKKYAQVQRLVPLLREARIDPFSFFYFCIEQRRIKNIPPTITSMSTATSVRHYLNYKKRNEYRVSTMVVNKDHLQTLFNQIAIDHQTLATFLLRKARPMLMDQDLFILSEYSLALLVLSGVRRFELSEQASVFYEDLQFNPGLLEQIKARWNQSLGIQCKKLANLKNELRSEAFNNQVQETWQLLQNLKISG